MRNVSETIRLLRKGLPLGLLVSHGIGFLASLGVDRLGDRPGEASED